MTKLVYCVRRLPDMSREDFQRYWRENHGPLVKERAAALNIKRYVQVHTMSGGLNDALRASRPGSEEAFDGVAELWFEGPDALIAATSTPEGRKAAQELQDDERKFIDFERSVIFAAQEYPVVEG